MRVPNGQLACSYPLAGLERIRAECFHAARNAERSHRNVRRCTSASTEQTPANGSAWVTASFIAIDPNQKGGVGMETAAITQWTFMNEVAIPADVGALMVPGEHPWTAFKTFRDTAIFTNKRLIVRDSQGLTGKKIEIYSLPYSAINMWSTENAGVIDFNAEVELWTRAGHIKIKVGKGADIRRIDMLIAHAVLGSA